MRRIRIYINRGGFRFCRVDILFVRDKLGSSGVQCQHGKFR
jgi:hypothetical protein